MAATNAPRRKDLGTRNVKLLITAVSLTTTLGGWALLGLNPPPPPDDAASEQDVAVEQPTLAPTAAPTPAPAPAQPVVKVVIPPLSALPVRGLREVGEPVYVAPPAPAQVFVAPPPQTHSNGGGQSQPPPAAAAPAPAPKPAPVTKTKGSKP